MSRSAVAKRYARGLMQAVLAAPAAVDAAVVAGDLENLADTIRESTNLELVTLNPAINPGTKAAILDEVAARLQATDMARQFVALVARKQRLAELPAMARAFRDEVDAHQGIVNAQVTTPTALDEAAVESLREKLAAATGNTVRLETRVDPALLGGLVTRIGDVLYDGSLRQQLAHLRSRMMQGREAKG